MTVPMLERLYLRGFRSFPAAVVEFDNPTFLVGQNGAGKSNLVDAFAFLSDAMNSRLSTVFNQRSGYVAVGSRSGQTKRPLNLGIRLKLAKLNEEVCTADYAFELRYLKDSIQVKRERCILRRNDGSCVWFDRTSDGFKSSGTKSLNPSLELNALALPLVGGDSRFKPVLDFLSEMRVYSIDPAVLRGMQDTDSGNRLNSDGSNTTSVLREIARQSPVDLEILIDLLGAIVPGMVDIKPKEYRNKLTLELTQEFKSKKTRFESFSLSDGTLRAVGLLTAIFQTQRPKVLLIEEPEATIHPGALGAVLDALWHAKRFMQVIVATHSPDILEAKWIEDRHLRIVTWDDGCTHVARVSADTREALREHLMDAGELMRSGTLLAASADDLFSQSPNKVPLFKGGLG